MKISLTYLKTYALAFLSILVVGCDSGPSLTWNPEIKTMTKGDLSSWLKSVPFSGIWDPNDNTEGNVYITNTREVYPFMGTLINEDDNLTQSSEKYKPFYQEKYVVFKDNKWGESVVYGALLYDTQELYMRSSFSKSGNIIVDGINNANNYNYASLEETHMVSNETHSKSAVYWVRGNNTSYLMGFYQQDQLVFQVAFPCARTEKEKGLNKLQEITNALNLKNPAWQTQEPKALTVNSNPISFWENPYEKLYMRLGMMPALQVKLKNTLFEDLDFREIGDSPGTYRVTIIKDDQRYTLDIAQEKTTFTSLQWQENEEYKPIDGAVNNNRRYNIEVTTGNGMTTQKYTTYFKDNMLFTFTYTFPAKDTSNASTLETILKTAKIQIYGF